MITAGLVIIGASFAIGALAAVNARKGGVDRSNDAFINLAALGLVVGFVIFIIGVFA